MAYPSQPPTPMVEEGNSQSHSRIGTSPPRGTLPILLTNCCQHISWIGSNMPHSLAAIYLTNCCQSISGIGSNPSAELSIRLGHHSPSLDQTTSTHTPTWTHPPVDRVGYPPQLNAISIQPHRTALTPGVTSLPPGNYHQERSITPTHVFATAA